MKARRLYLPGGGSFDLALSGDVILNERDVLTSGAAACPSPLVPVLVGALVGGALTGIGYYLWHRSRR